MFPRGLKHNIKYYLWYYALSGFIFQIPIWVAFYTQVVTLPELAIINALESLLTLSLEVPTGALADMVGRRTTVVAGSILLCIFFCLIPFATSFMGLLALVIVSGTGSALISGADSALIYDSLKELGREKEAGAIFAKVGLLYRIGLVLATLVGGYLFGIWRGLPHIARAITTMGAAFCIWLMVEPSIDSEKFTWARYIKQTKEGIKELTHSHYMRIITIFYIGVAGISFACLTFFNQPFAYEFGYTPMQMSWITSGAYLITSTILYLVSLHDNWLSRKLVYLGFPLLMVTSLVPGLFVNKTVALLLMLGSQLAGSARFSILDKYMNKEFSSKNRATAASTLNMGVSLAMAVIIYLGGQIQGIFSARVAFTMLGLATAIFVLPFAFALISEHNRYHYQDLTRKLPRE